MKKYKRKVKTNKTKRKDVKTKTKPTLINFKVTVKEVAALKRAARKYADGDLSRWLRYAGTHCKARHKLPNQTRQ